jgi:hypothetical protein
VCLWSLERCWSGRVRVRVGRIFKGKLGFVWCWEIRGSRCLVCLWLLEKKSGDTWLGVGLGAVGFLYGIIDRVIVTVVGFKLEIYVVFGDKVAVST